MRIADVVYFHRLLPWTPETCSFHIRVRAFATFSDEAVDLCRDNSESIREQAGSGTEPSSSTAAPAGATPIPNQMMAKFMYHKRLMIDELNSLFRKSMPVTTISGGPRGTKFDDQFSLSDAKSTTDFSWTEGNVELEFSRVLLWTRDELESPITDRIFRHPKLMFAADSIACYETEKRSSRCFKRGDSR